MAIEYHCSARTDNVSICLYYLFRERENKEEVNKEYKVSKLGTGRLTEQGRLRPGFSVWCHGLARSGWGACSFDKWLILLGVWGA